MFVRDFIDVPLPFEAVAPRLVRNEAWLNPIAHDALEEAAATLDALRPDPPRQAGLPPLSVHLTRGPVRLRADSLVMPLHWETNLPASVLPGVNGDLEVSPLGQDRSQVAVSATTWTSSAEHDGITRRVVETGLRSFLRRLAVQLERGS